jgi:hypothetical protein
MELYGDSDGDGESVDEVVDVADEMSLGRKSERVNGMAETPGGMVVAGVKCEWGE